MVYVNQFSKSLKIDKYFKINKQLKQWQSN